VLLISKTDLISPEQLQELLAILQNLNPGADIIPMARGNVPLSKIINTGKFNFDKAQQSPGWLKEMRGQHMPETEEYGISSFSYHARRPFHPKKLHDFFSTTFDYTRKQNGKLLRSKGFFWLASRPQWAGQWSQAGGIAQHGAAGMFWKAIPKENWPDDQEQIEYIMEKWQEPFGDMRQELVFIGQNLNAEELTSELDKCLLNEDELLQGQSYWKTLEDPFPSWTINEAH
jgi:G3E family GTPase